MLTSKNIHFAILGIIIGASAAYVFAFYQAQSAMPPTAVSQPSAASDLPAGHPGTNVAVEDLKKQVESNPNDPDLLARYGTSLFTTGNVKEAINVYKKVISLQPENMTVRSLLIAMHFSQGQMEEAKQQAEAALKQKPDHVPTLHGYFLVTLEGDKDIAKAEGILKQIEKLSPNYQGLADLKSRLEEMRKAAK